MYRHTAIISGRGRFPVDMLRYDSAYPETEIDASQISRSLTDGGDAMGRYEVHIAKRGYDKNDTFTAGRWQSFGFSVDFITSEKTK